MGDPAERPARLKVGVIGAGRVGTVLGAALERAGHQVVAVSAVSDRSLDRAGRMLPGRGGHAPAGAAGRGGPRPAHCPRRRAARPGLRPGRHRRAAGRAADGAHQWPARHRGAGARHRAWRAPAGAAPGHDVHRAPGRSGPADRHQLRGDRPGAAAARRRGPGHRDGRRARAHRRGGPPAVPRRRWPARPTTWSRWWPSRPTCSARPG